MLPIKTIPTRVWRLVRRQLCAMVRMLAAYALGSGANGKGGGMATRA
jgi:hypothetical protein